MAQSNLPELSKRARLALDLLGDGGEMVHRLERDPYTGRDKFQTRFKGLNGIVKGLGFQTRIELERNGFRFIPVHSTSVSTYFKLDKAA